MTPCPGQDLACAEWDQLKLAEHCPTCGADPGVACRTSSGNPLPHWRLGHDDGSVCRRVDVHMPRLYAAHRTRRFRTRVLALVQGASA